MSIAGDTYKLYIDKLHEAAASGDVNAILTALKVLPDINATNSKGWTALMFAARNGHKDVAVALIDNGCDSLMVNAVGQTAKDIAEFWCHDEVAQLLSTKEPTTAASSVLNTTPESITRINYFCGNPLDRMSQRRKDVAWLGELAAKSTTVYILFTGLNVVIKQTVGTPAFRLVRFTQAQIASVLETKPTVVFLGVENSASEGETAVEGGSAWFAIETGALTDDQLKQLNPDAITASLRTGFLAMSRPEAAITAQARSVLAWHDRYLYCPTCGGPSRVDEAGYKRTCLNNDCRSNKGVHNTCYPRSDPTVIMAIVSPDGKKLLLGRGKQHPPGMWSCLAGFMEPGESIEEACRREVYEESRIRVGAVKYHSSQPWPMPSTLMIGCIGFAESSAIQVDKEELEEVRWFEAQEVRQMMAWQHPQSYFCPPDQAIAHQLIKHWLSYMSKL